MSFKENLVAFLKSYGIVPEKKEQMVAIELIYSPDTIDAHGEWMSGETLINACDNFNKNLEAGVVKSNLFHLQDTELFTVEETWIQKEFDATVNETGEVIKAGSWIAKIQYHDKDLWELKKAGVLGGVSIGGKGLRNPETGELTNISFDSDIESGED